MAVQKPLLYFELLSSDCNDCAQHVFAGCVSRGIFACEYKDMRWKICYKKGKYTILDFTPAYKQVKQYAPQFVIRFLKDAVVSIFDVYAIKTATALAHKLINFIADYQDEKKLEIPEGQSFFVQNFLSELEIDDVEITLVYPPTQSPRELPGYRSYWTFGDIIDDFWQSDMPYDKRMAYAPLYLYWLVANVIPTRPKEFVVTPADCLINEQNRMFLALRKCKIKGSRHRTLNLIYKDYPIYRYAIIQKIFDLFSWYCKETAEHFVTINQYDVRLFSTYWYDRYFGTKSDEEFTVATLTRLLHRFYAEVIQEDYGYTLVTDDYNPYIDRTGRIAKKHPNVYRKEIGMWCLGDIRHLTILSMVLRGVDPVYIAEYAGHDDIETQIHYARSIGKTLDLDVQHVLDRSFDQIAYIRSGSQGTPVEGGYCINYPKTSEDAKRCVSGNYCNDGVCPYYRLNSDNNVLSNEDVFRDDLHKAIDYFVLTLRQRMDSDHIQSIQKLQTAIENLAAYKVMQQKPIY